MRCSFADVIAKKIIQVNLTEKTPKNISIPETEMKIVFFLKNFFKIGFTEEIAGSIFPNMTDKNMIREKIYTKLTQVLFIHLDTIDMMISSFLSRLFNNLKLRIHLALNYHPPPFERFATKVKLTFLNLLFLHFARPRLPCLLGLLHKEKSKIQINIDF